MQMRTSSIHTYIQCLSQALLLRKLTGFHPYIVRIFLPKWIHSFRYNFCLSVHLLLLLPSSPTSRIPRCSIISNYGTTQLMLYNVTLHFCILGTILLYNRSLNTILHVFLYCDFQFMVHESFRKLSKGVGLSFSGITLNHHFALTKWCLYDRKMAN